MAFKSNEYTTGGVHAPHHKELTEGAEACNMDAACTSTAVNNPNIDNVDPGSHHERGAGKSAK